MKKKDQDKNNIGYVQNEVFMGLNIYDRLLYTLILFNYQSRSSLLILSNNKTDPQLTYRAIKKALEANHIKELELSYKDKSKKKTVTYYAITLKGIKYLKEKSETVSVIKWLSHIDTDISRLKRGGRIMGTERIQRFLSISTSSLMAAMCNFKVSPVYLSEVTSGFESEAEYENSEAENKCKAGESIWDSLDDFEDEAEEKTNIKTEKRNDLEGIVKRALECEAESKQNNDGKYILNNISNVIFTNSIEIKRKVINYTGKINEYRGGRFTGIIESPSKTVLTYYGSKTGMSFSSWTLKKELPQYHLYTNEYGIYKNLKPSENYGVVFVENAKVTTDLILNKKGKMKEDEYFGLGFTSFNIFPVTQEGVINLKSFMEIDSTEKFEADFIDSAIKSNLYSKSEGGYSDIFPLINTEGTLMAIGIYIDAVKIHKIRMILERKPDLKFGIICKTWQIEYYKRVLEKSEFMTVEVN